MMIKTATLKASVHFVADTTDPRFYLTGVQIQATGNRLIVVSTNGHALSAFSDDLDDPVTEPFEIIIPIDTIKAALKSKMRAVPLIELADGRWALGDSIFTPVDGRFPDFNRVIPASDKVGDGRHLNIQPKYYTAATKALNDYYVSKNDQTNHVQDNIEGKAIFHRGDNRAIVLVMAFAPSTHNPPYMGFRGVL